MAQRSGPGNWSARTRTAPVPHCGPALLLAGLRSADPERCRAWMEVESGAWYLQEDGTLPAWFALEALAQTVAAYSGHGAQSEGRAPKRGFLLGTQSFECQVPAFRVGTILELEARLCFADPTGLGAFECSLHANGELMARSTLKVFEEP